MLRLDWVGNFNSLLRQDVREFFCYRQHDDTTSDDFFETLLRAADKDPTAAAIYCDCQFTGARDDLEITPSIKGETLDRMLQFIESVPASAAPVRGLIRKDAIRQAGLVRSDEFRAPLEVFVWLAKLLRWGNFKRVGKRLYNRLDHPRSFTSEYFRSQLDRMQPCGRLCSRDCWRPRCRCAYIGRERLFFQQFICDRIVVDWPMGELTSSEHIVTKCMERLRFEGNSHLLGEEELPPLLEQLKFQPDGKLLERSRMRRVIYRIRKRSRMARIIYPNSYIRRVSYQFDRLLQEAKNKIKMLLTLDKP